MISEFNWWLLLLGLVVGGGLTWLVLAETRRREQDLEEADLADEAVWLEERLAEEVARSPRTRSSGSSSSTGSTWRSFRHLTRRTSGCPLSPPGRARMPGGPPGGKEPRPGSRG